MKLEGLVGCFNKFYCLFGSFKLLNLSFSKIVYFEYDWATSPNGLKKYLKNSHAHSQSQYGIQTNYPDCEIT